MHLLTHSQAGPYGWSLADARPESIVSITALEPAGPPFVPDIHVPGIPVYLWGLGDIPLNYTPPLPNNSPEALNAQKIVVNDPSIDAYTCYAQSPPLRTLPNLASIPVQVVASSSSWLGHVSSCIVRYLMQVGVHVDYVRLQDVGFPGHGHMFFIEVGSIEIVQEVVGPWLRKHDKRIGM